MTAEQQVPAPGSPGLVARYEQSIMDRITEEVDPVEEMGAITYMVGKRIGSPALLFDNIKGHQGRGRALFNLLGSSNRRIALTMGMEPDRPPMELIQEARERLSRRLPPVEVDARNAPVNEIVLRGDDIDLTKLPAPKHWPLDGQGQPGEDVGRYIGTADAVLTRDPDTGVVNIGTYRMMVQSKDEVGLYLIEHHATRLVDEVVFVLWLEEAMFKPVREYGGELKVGGVLLLPGMTAGGYSGGTTGNVLWLIAPGIAIITVVMGFTLVGHAMEAVLDPKLRER